MMLDREKTMMQQEGACSIAWLTVRDVVEICTDLSIPLEDVLIRGQHTHLQIHPRPRGMLSDRPAMLGTHPLPGGEHVPPPPR